ncbi:uncharacterized protein BCN122_I0198 [Burkholderia cenocepacia]|nr:uncharacterized protein BCN122_I0198 [Burkholderia cenocepacia]
MHAGALAERAAGFIAGGFFRPSRCAPTARNRGRRCASLIEP